jgi:hypothetical protein
MQGFSVESKTFGISSSSTLWQDFEARTSHAMKQTWLQEATDSTREDDCSRRISVNLEYLLYIGFDYDFQLARH